VMAAGLSNILL